MTKYPIDYCIITLDGVKPFLELHLESLMKTETFDSFASLNIIDKESGKDLLDYVREIYPPVNIYECDFYTPLDRMGNTVASGWQWDLAYTLEVVMENCGDAEWILFAHPDIVYFEGEKYWNQVWDLVSDSVGVIRDGSSLMIRRKAYEMSHLKFWPLFGAVIQRKSTPFAEKGVILNENQTSNPIRIFGIETGEFLRVELQSFGWEVVILPYRITRDKDHLCQCTKHDMDMNNPAQNKLWKTKMKSLYSRLERLRAGRVYI